MRLAFAGCCIELKSTATETTATAAAATATAAACGTISNLRNSTHIIKDLSTQQEAHRNVVGVLRWGVNHAGGWGAEMVVVSPLRGIFQAASTHGHWLEGSAQSARSERSCSTVGVHCDGR